MTKPHTAETDVHFTPPSVPDGDAPMNIIRENTRIGPTASVDRSIVLYPTVVMADIVWKNESSKRCPQSWDAAAVWLKARRAVPPMVIMQVISKMTLVVNVSE